jgi:hypothetical protein
MMILHVLEYIEKLVVSSVEHLLESSDSTIDRLKMEKAGSERRMVEEKFANFSSVVGSNQETKLGRRKMQ